MACCGLDATSLLQAITFGKKGKKKHKTTPAGNPLPRFIHQTIPAAATAGRRVLVIGDVHGCLEDLELLLENVALPTDLVVITGDVSGKGPDVLDTIKYLSDHGILSVRGNHDDRAVGVYRAWKEKGVSPRKEFEWVKHLNGHYADFLLNLPFTVTLEAYNVVVVHGGLLPGLTLEQQSMEELYTIRDVVPAHPPPFGTFSWAQERRALAAAVASGRINVPPAFQLEARERPVINGRPWCAEWQGPHHVIFGHASSRRLQVEPFATGVDTGCVGGGYLSAAILPALSADGTVDPDYQPLPPTLYQQTIRLFDGEGINVRVAIQPSLQPNLGELDEDLKGKEV